MDQSSKMIKMRIKADVWSQGLSPETRDEIRERVRVFFCRDMAPRTVYLYLQGLRVMETVGPVAWRNGDMEKSRAVGMGGLEDAIANGPF
jgi:hypothetical protein